MQTDEFLPLVLDEDVVTFSSSIGTASEIFSCEEANAKSLARSKLIAGGCSTAFNSSALFVRRNVSANSRVESSKGLKGSLQIFVVEVGASF